MDDHSRSRSDGQADAPDGLCGAAGPKAPGVFCIVF